MFRLSAAALAAGLLAVAAGVTAGEAAAMPAFTPGVQTTQPITRPFLTNYVLPVPLTSSDSVTMIEVGRDDTSPYVMFFVQFGQGNPVLPPQFMNPPYLPVGMPAPFVYRPIWDSALYPNLTNATGGPIGGRVDGQWIAIDTFVRALQNFRAATTHGGTLWLDPLSPPNSMNNHEFYKFKINY